MIMTFDYQTGQAIGKQYFVALPKLVWLGSKVIQTLFHYVNLIIQSWSNSESGLTMFNFTFPFRILLRNESERTTLLQRHLGISLVVCVDGSCRKVSQERRFGSYPARRKLGYSKGTIHKWRKTDYVSKDVLRYKQSLRRATRVLLEKCIIKLRCYIMLLVNGLTEPRGISYLLSVIVRVRVVLLVTKVSTTWVVVDLQSQVCIFRITWLRRWLPLR